jgi:glutaminyl-tRNA synthetase
LFTKENPNDLKDGEHFIDYVNPESMKVLRGCYVEPSLAEAKPGSYYQFLRQGYFCIDTVDSTEGHPVFNRIVTLRDTWARIQKKG